MTRPTAFGFGIPFGASLSVTAAMFALASQSRADQPALVAQGVVQSSDASSVSETMPPPDAVKPYEVWRRPNYVLVGTGATAFGLSYAISLIAAASSDHHGDTDLFVPVIGPWLDTADRRSCGVSGSSSCDSEHGNSVGLVVDGIFQGLGVLAIAGGFVFPETTYSTSSRQPDAVGLHFAPIRYGREGVGLAAIGTF
jgi:hypothetical protein